ncbi:MAG TPA: hypothetical protein IAC18_07990 [Candidatus Scatomorpha merdipullorum]|uniref:Polymer-forming cytoskeletal protein n=1 Tax=Candidatus Scatomorpha merdipullorum TaxID=2840927 RepID=A0A9D1JVP0_9FIRM|nr:hypothetical protein [Candidatus Scatomorpha merdipullorum]
MKKKLIIALVLVFALGLAGAGVWAASSAGTESDPLVAMSYLTDELEPRLQREIDEAIEEALGGASAASGGFVGEELSAGALRLSVGTELMCLSGGAYADGELVDLTAGGVLSAGEALSVNHLYLCAGRDTLLSGQGEILLRGEYSAA